MKREQGRVNLAALGTATAVALVVTMGVPLAMQSTAPHVDMPFTLGTSFQLFASMNALGQAISSSGVDDTEAVSNFASTGTWGGISGVHLANGTVVSDFSVRSDSGFDWAHAYSAVVPPVTAVPEPGTYALMLGGLAVLGRVARRRRLASAP